MSSVLQLKKETKKTNLINAAYELFTSQGLNHTSVDDIVMKAQVAKGTFYLYFKDKAALIEEVMFKVIRNILLDAYVKMQSIATGDFVQDVLLFTDHIIEYFRHNKLTLRLIERNLSWASAYLHFYHCEKDPHFLEMVHHFTQNPQLAAESEDEAITMLFILVTTCCSVCYSSIMHGLPDKIEEVKPILYKMIRRMLS